MIATGILAVSTAVAINGDLLVVGTMLLVGVNCAVVFAMESSSRDARARSAASAHEDRLAEDVLFGPAQAAVCPRVYRLEQAHECLVDGRRDV